MTKTSLGKISGGNFSLKWLGWRVIFCGKLLKKGHRRISDGEWENFGWRMGKFRVEKHLFESNCLKKRSSEIWRSGKCYLKKPTYLHTYRQYEVFTYNSTLILLIIFI